MPWVRLPDELPDMDGVAEIDDASFRLHITALCYSNRLLKDGRIPTVQVRRLTDAEDPRALVDRLIGAGWWHEAEGGYQLVYLLDLQPTRETVERERELARDRQTAFRNRQTGRFTTDADPERNGVTNDRPGPGSGPGPVNPAPVPEIRPAPSAPEASGGARTRAAQPLAAANGQTAAAAAPQDTPRSTTPRRMARIVDLVREAGVPIRPTSRDGGALKSCAAPEALVADAYIAAARGDWDPGGDGFLRGNLSLHAVIDRLGGYEAERESQDQDGGFLETRYGRLVRDHDDHATADRRPNAAAG